MKRVQFGMRCGKLCLFLCDRRISTDNMVLDFANDIAELFSGERGMWSQKVHLSEPFNSRDGPVLELGHGDVVICCRIQRYPRNVLNSVDDDRVEVAMLLVRQREGT